MATCRHSVTGTGQRWLIDLRTKEAEYVPPQVIAIDGPAGSGKSTVARAVADRLCLEYLDTGAMYRGVAHAVLRCGVAPNDAEAVATVARAVDLDLSLIHI